MECIAVEYTMKINHTGIKYDDKNDVVNQNYDGDCDNVNCDK